MTGHVGKVKQPERIAVVGAGIGGLCTAARLAKAGHLVTIFESSNRTGGKCRTEWIGRYAFDTGPSLLTLPAVYRDFFQRTGDVMGRVLEIEEVNPSFDYRFHDGKSVKFSNLSRKKTLAAISESLGEEAALEWDALMRQAEAMWDVSRGPFVESELKSPLSLLKRPRLMRDLKTIAPWKSLRGIGIRNPYLAKIMDRYATYSGSDPRVAPAVLSTIAFVEEAFGAWHVKGGVGTLSEKITERCEKLGVTIRLNTYVDEITTKSGTVTGVVVQGHHEEFDRVVANADAQFVYNNLMAPTNKVVKIRKQLAKSEPSLAGFSLLLGLKPSTAEPLAHHTILFPENYDLEFESIFTSKTPVEKPTIYICAPRDPLMVKDAGHEAWFVLVNAPRHDPYEGGFDWSDAEFNQRYAHSIINQIEATGIAVRERLEVLEIRTPLDLQESVHAPGGSIYGSSSNGARSAFSRAKNRSPIKGLYLVGGSAHPGGGLPLVGLSAEIVANAILD
ncbi:phytoene desaturase family protein [Candidatus Planktophila versatilis]|uniref:phytoene desaturase family protein n=1 Tax=Candidatus Planktophila versatilis TaxID=1884905 RepID=UPI000BACC945|nr:phytoene desaturase family protein [Candidatus Planktophila versatilis]ASY26256.1 putative phytoene desaturase [Candidatus Planktophila versatilis]